jgi:hypothetical protein
VPPTKEQLKGWLAEPAALSDLAAQIRSSPSRAAVLDMLRRSAPTLTIAPTTYTLYREFEHSGSRDGYQHVYYARRSQLTRAVMELLLGDETRRDDVHDLMWAICEETSWVLPAHEEQGPAFWEIDPPVVRERPLGAHTALTRQPDAIDLFAAETGSSLAEALYLLGDRIAPEVRQRVRQEVQRHIFGPYLAHGREHWWYKGALNWNGVCNSAIGLAFVRLEQDLETLAEALAQVLEGVEAYIATGFEPDGGSIEGVGYWNYGLMYYITLAELLRERTAGRLDLLADPRLRAIAAYPPLMNLSPNRYLNPGDASEELIVAPGVVQRLAERAEVPELRAMIAATESINRFGVYSSKLAVVMRDAAWWDGQSATPPPARDGFLPDCGVVKLVGQASDGRPITLAAVAGHNDGHHSHCDVGSFIIHLDGSSLLCDPGPGLYSREYFRRGRYDNLFNSSLGHSVPRIGGQLQSPGPEFGGRRQFYGTILSHSFEGGQKQAQIDMRPAYDLPTLREARRSLWLSAADGAVLLEDSFAFSGPPLEIEEALVSWGEVQLDGATARISAGAAAIELRIEEPAGASFAATRLEQACRENHKQQTLTRLTVNLPAGTDRFRVRMAPLGVAG